MKKIFNIEIKETMNDIFEIEAESSGEAEYLAEKGFYDGEYILDSVEPGHRELTFCDIESSHYISDDRKKSIFWKLIDYVREHTIDEKDYYRALKNTIRLTDSEITELGIDVKRQLIEIAPLQNSEIEFEDELTIEYSKNTRINAYIPLYYINIFEKFALKKQEGFEYNMYLDYYKDENKSVITITEKNDTKYAIYEYETSSVENEMLKNKLDEYCKSQYNQSIEEFMDNEEEREED